MKRKIKTAVLVTLIVGIYPFQRIFAQEGFEENTIDTVPISDALPFLLVGAIVLAFVFFRKMKTANE